MSGRKFLSLLFVSLIALSFAGVQAQDGQTQITWLTLSDWGGNINTVVEAFEAENPDIDVVIEQVPFNSLFEQIQVRLTSQSTDPDVISVDVPLVTGYAVRNWLLPLEDAFNEEQFADWLPAAVQAGSYNDHLLAAPISTSTQLLFINYDLFEAAGVEAPGPDDRWTYEQIAAVAPQLTQDTNGDGTPDIWGFNWEQTVRIYQLQHLPVSLGGQAIGEDGLTVDGIINSPEWVQAFTYYQDIFNALGVAPREDTIPTPDLFLAGNMAMMVGGPWQINNLIREDVPFNWGVSRHPYFEEGELVTPTGSWHIGVNAYTDQPEAAKRFVAWISTGEGAELWWRDGSGDFPAQQSVLAMFQTDEQFDEMPYTNFRTAADEATQNAAPRPSTPGYLEYEQILQNTFTDIRNGVDVQEALNTAVDRITSEMDKYRR